MDRAVLDGFVVQWRKMKDALESQQLRLKEASPQGEPRTTPGYEPRIGELIQKLDELLKDHGAERT
jgi:hypothetical protein